MSTAQGQSAAAESMPALRAEGLRGRQVLGILRLEIKKNLLSKRVLGVYLLAFGPLSLALLHLALMTFGLIQDPVTPSQAAFAFAQLFEFYLRVSVFFSAAFLFLNLFRSEVQERSLHYYLLTPVRREVLVAGKYVSALLAGSMIFAIGTVLTYLAMLIPGGISETLRYLFQGPGFGQLLTYIGITTLACAGYGAVFLLLSVVARAPLFMSVLFWVWEALSFVLPPLLKKLTISHYLQSLYPIPLDARLVAVMAEPTPAWLSVPILVFVTATALFVAGLKSRRMEINYGGD